MYSISCLCLLICCCCAKTCDVLDIGENKKSFCKNVYEIVQKHAENIDVDWKNGPEFSRQGSTVAFSVEYGNDKYFRNNSATIRFHSFKTVSPKGRFQDSFHRALLFSEDTTDVNNKNQVAVELADSAGTGSSGANKRHEVIISHSEKKTHVQVIGTFKHQIDISFKDLVEKSVKVWLTIKKYDVKYGLISGGSSNCAGFAYALTQELLNSNKRNLQYSDSSEDKEIGPTNEEKDESQIRNSKWSLRELKKGKRLIYF